MPDPLDFLAGGGELGARMRATDWARTPLGPAADWPQSLKTCVRIILTSRQPMFVWWGEELINLYNDAYKSIVGGKHPWALGRPASEVWREIWDEIAPRAASAMQSNEGTYDEALLLIMERHGYAEETYYTFSYSPVPNDRGGTGGILCANTDDTQRIIGERQLALLRNLAAASGDARTFEEACRRSAESLGTNPHDIPFAMIYLVDRERQRVELAGCAGIEAGHPAAPATAPLNDGHAWPFADVLASEKPAVVDNLGRFFDDLPSGAWDRPPHSAVVVPLAHTVVGGQTGILIVGLNPFRLYDASYRRFIDLIAAQIGASFGNAQAHEDERRRAESLAELDRAKTAFFSNVSHEFRTPLTLMLAPLEDLLAKPEGEVLPENRSVLAVVERNGRRLLKLVNTLLDFSRIEAGRVQASYEPTDLAAYTAELASVFRAAVERAGLRLVIDAPPLGEPVYVDRDMWEKIVLNLVSNAFKYTLEGEIAVSVHRTDGHAAVSVRDTGIGIPLAELPKLFNRFHRVEGARGRTLEGTGIGLALVQELARLHGGTVSVESVEGEGSTFTVTVPLGTEHLPQDRINAVRTLASTSVGARSYAEEALRWLPGTGDNVRLSTEEMPLIGRVASAAGRPCIVLADDNADMRDYVRRLLAPQYDVVAVADGVEALHAVAEHKPDLVLTDVMMPNLDGFGLLRELRASPATSGIPVIMLSARAGEEARVEGLQAGADDYLVKPFSARELLARVAGLLALAQVRTAANLALRHSEERYRSLIEAAAAIVWSTPASGAFEMPQPEWTAFTGQPFEKLQGAGWLEAVHPDDRDETLRAWESARRRGVRYETQHRLRHRDGDYRYMSARAVPLRNEDGSVREWIGVHTDMTVERRLQQALESERVTLRNIFKRAPAFMATLRGPEHVFEIANPQYMQIIGEGRDVIGKTIREALPEIEGQGFFELLDRVYETGEPYVGAEARIMVSRTGVPEERYVDFVYQPMRDAEGAVTGIFVHGNDITEQVRARRIVERQAEELERANLALLEAQEALREADRRKDEFIATLSHELRTPLTAILGWARILQMPGNDAETASTAIETINRSAEVQAQLIEDVLDISRITTGKVRIASDVVDVTNVAEAALETVRLAAAAKGVRLESHMDRGEMQVLGDGSRLQQVVWNLLSNAIKFTPEGGKVELTLRRTAAAVALEVRDTGIGIRSDFLAHIFEPFRQAETTTTRVHGGLGLGLSIVRYLVELHGGRITAESAGEGRGSTFLVELPRLRPKSETAGAAPVPAAAERQARHSDIVPLHGVSVLVIDDQHEVRAYLTAALRRSGARVRTAASVREAVEAVREEEPEVILCDIAMPHEDGFAFLGWLKEHQSPLRTPVIAVTALGGQGDEERVRAAGFTAYVRKPVEPDDLARAVAATRNAAVPGG